MMLDFVDYIVDLGDHLVRGPSQEDGSLGDFTVVQVGWYC
jgi:hypothetical protein